MLEWMPRTGLVGALTVLSLFAVWIPLYRGARVCLAARGATRRIGSAALRKALGQKPTPKDPLGLVMLRVFARARRSGDAGLTSDFALDASKQYAVNEYETSYARTISMYANLLPPIGFIGTTTGMLVLFVSMHLSESSLELGALAIALLSSIFALIGFASLEALKIRLHNRLLAALDEVAALPQEAAPSSS